MKDIEPFGKGKINMYFSLGKPMTQKQTYESMVKNHAIIKESCKRNDYVLFARRI